MAYLSKSEVARRLGCSRRVVQKWARVGLLTQDKSGRVDIDTARQVAERKRKAGRRIKSDFRVWDDPKANQRWLAGLSRGDRNPLDQWLRPTTPEGLQIEASLERKWATGHRLYGMGMLGTVLADTKEEAVRQLALRILAHVLSPDATDKRKLPILALPHHTLRETLRGVRSGTVVWGTPTLARKPRPPMRSRAERNQRTPERVADASGKPHDSANLLKLWHCCKFAPCSTQLYPLPLEPELDKELRGVSGRHILAIAAQFVLLACRCQPPQEFSLLMSNEERAEFVALLQADKPTPDKLRDFKSSRYARRRTGKVAMRGGAVSKMVTLHGLLGCNRAMALHWRKSTRKLFREVERLVEPPPTGSTAEPETEGASDSLFDQQLETHSAVRRGRRRSEQKPESWGFDTGADDLNDIRCGKCKHKLKDTNAPCPHCQPKSQPNPRKV